MAPPGLLRLNERTQRPNVCINFIKPLASASPEDQEIAKDFLERIAAQCYPVMKDNHIIVMTLEEHESNPEFIGRNFNAGECIQLVLKDRADRWLSFKSVQMVMMHELAHCKQMNHSRNFWKVRNQYADEMKQLWTKKYAGEGLWGRGQDLSSGAFMHDNSADPADLPQHECGGVYRTARGKKRKRGQDDSSKPKMTYAERQQKRIAKKFGSHGEGHAIGEDEMVRGGLEQGKRSSGKPRVAQSKRGRELRANAALARFETAKQQQTSHTPKTEDRDDSETNSDDDDDDAFADGLNILDTLEKIKDQKGRDMYKVCGHEDEQDEGRQNEMDDFRLLAVGGSRAKMINKSPTLDDKNDKQPLDLQEDSETASESEFTHDNSLADGRLMAEKKTALKQKPANLARGESDRQAQKKSQPAITKPAPLGFDKVTACPICSLENEPDSPTCLACSHVLKPSLMPNNWRCSSDVCKGSVYVNAGDVGRCGVCGASKPAVAPIKVKAMGVVGGDVLRWD